LTYISSAAHTVSSLNVTGVYALTLSAQDSAETTIFSSIVDGATTDTLTTINVIGAGNTTITAITDTALTAINASAATGAFTLTAASQVGLTVTGAAAAANTITASGNNDVIIINNTAATVAESVTANGANTSVTLTHTGTNTATSYAIAANGTGAQIDTSGWASSTSTTDSTISATGANAILTLGAGTTGNVVNVTLGSNATVTLGAAGVGAGFVNLDVSGAVTGGTSASYALTTIKGDAATTNTLTVDDQGTEVFNSAAINVANVTTLAAALDIAAAGNGGTNGIINWFQFGGNTYIVDDNSAATSLAATDVVVMLTGLVDSLTASGNVITLS
jgi:S-layer protein